jgi:DNA-binding response OmpR family regulator
MKKKVLFIEDDQMFANIYRNKLVLDGFEVEIASDGEAGLELLRQFKPDLVLLDLMLPKLSGIDVIKRIRVESDSQKLPVVVFTNTYLTSMLQDAWKAGANKCLTKASCTPNQVIGTLQNILSANGEAKTAATVSNKHTPEAKRPPVPPPRTPVPSKADTQYEAGLRKSFRASLPATIAAIRTQLQALAKADSESARQVQVNELYTRIHTLTGSSGIVGMSHIAQLTDALEALLSELYEKPQNINASTIRTVAAAVDFLALLADLAPDVTKDVSAARVMVVDDEDISRRAVSYALEKARLKSVSMDDPEKALDRLMLEKFDLIFLDVGMPKMTGFELCTRLRSLPNYKKTPVVFITSLNDFETKANSTMSGGNDCIAKPFLFIELAVKALVYIWRSRLPAVKK